MDDFKHKRNYIAEAIEASRADNRDSAEPLKKGLAIVLRQGRTALDKMEAAYRFMDPIIEGHIGAIEKNEGQKMSCKRGCNHCCYILPMVTRLEVQAIEEYARKYDIPISTKAVRRQARLSARDGTKFLAENYKDESINFKYVSEVPLQKRKCVLLKEGLCSVYSMRPLSCRLHYVVSPAEKCNTERDWQRDILSPNNFWIHTTFIEALMEYDPNLASAAFLSEGLARGRGVSL